MSPSTIHQVRKVYKIASIPADGIGTFQSKSYLTKLKIVLGPEVISAGIEVLQKLASVVGTFEFQFDHFDWGSDYYKRHGKYIPEGGLDQLKKYNAIFFGSVGAPGTLECESSQNTWELRKSIRCPGSHITLGSPLGHLSAPPAVCQRETHQSITWDDVSVERLQSRGLGLGHRPRKFRRRVRRSRRPHPCRPPVGSIYRSCHFLALCCREDHAFCLRDRAEAT